MSVISAPRLRVRPPPTTARPVEIFATDRASADLLVDYASPAFSAEIVPGFVWVVRLLPLAAGAGWALELLSLIERWLEAAERPWATVIYGDRNYLIRSTPTS